MTAEDRRRRGKNTSVIREENESWQMNGDDATVNGEWL